MVFSNFLLIDGIPGWGQKVWVVRAELNDEGIFFTRASIKNSPSVTLRYEQITSEDTLTEEEIIEKSKSVIGRGLVGSLFGPVGAVVGGMSGVGNKKKTIRHLNYIIRFTSSDGNPSQMILGTEVLGNKLGEFRSALREKINTPEESGYL